MTVRSLALLALVAPASAGAATLEVPSTHATLAEALAAASRNDVILVDGAAYAPERDTVTVPEGLAVTIEGILGSAGTTLPPVLVEGELTLVGVTLVEADLLTLPARNNSLLYVDGGTLLGEDIVLDPSVGPVGTIGLLAEDGASVEVSELIAEGFSATAVWLREGTSFTLDRPTLRDNGAALALAGALIVDDGASGSLIEPWLGQNSGLLAGGVLVTEADLTIDGGELELNTGTAGALWSDNSTVLLDRVDLRENVGEVAGDAVVDGTEGSVTIQGSSVNDSRGETGSFVTYGPTISILDTTISGVVGTRGGVLFVGRDGTALLEGAVVSDASADSGALAHVDGGTLTVRDALVTDLVTYEAGGISQTGGVLVIEDSTFLRVSAGDAGAMLDQMDGSAQLTNVSVVDASADIGGALHLVGGTLDATGLSISGAIVDGPGAAIYASGSVLTLADSVLEDTLSLRSTGALAVDHGTDLTVVRSRVCSVVSAFGSAAVTIDGGDEPDEDVGSTAVLTNNVFLGNGDGGISALAIASSAAQVDIVNNTFVGNFADQAALRVEASPISARLALDVRNNIFMGSPLGLFFVEAPTVVTGGYNLWWALDGEVSGDADIWFPSTTAVRADPDFQGYRVGDCGSNLWLSADSPARDTGDPEIIDVDGSGSDIGAFGGPDSGLADHDEDGVTEDLDCDDEDAGRHPGLEEIPGDGIDQDCDGEDEEPIGTDPTDGTDTPGSDEPSTGDDEPQNDPPASASTDDLLQDPDSWISGGCGCSSGAGSTGWLALLLLPILLRRRDHGGGR